jgi:hypothetical protein
MGPGEPPRKIYETYVFLAVESYEKLMRAGSLATAIAEAAA